MAREKQLERTFILCPIAMDAAPGDRGRSEYTGVGENFTVRLSSAIAWLRISPIYREHHWAFGAGTDKTHSSGLTLAAHSAELLLSQIPTAKPIINQDAKHFYGTYEEIEWIVAEVEKTFTSGTVRFVFFTQLRHMPRVRLIWWLFYQRKWGKAHFVFTTQTVELSWIREKITMLKVWGIYAGLIKPRSAEPYS